MPNAYERAKAAVLARANDPHLEECDSCAAYVNEVTRYELESTRSGLEAQITDLHRENAELRAQLEPNPADMGLDE